MVKKLPLRKTCLIICDLSFLYKWKHEIYLKKLKYKTSHSDEWCLRFSCAKFLQNKGLISKNGNLGFIC